MRKCQARIQLLCRRREQKKSACYQIANWIAREYDTAAIGDYLSGSDYLAWDLEQARYPVKWRCEK